MRRTIFTILFATAVTMGFAQNSLAGSWVGKLEAGPTSLTLVLNITQGESGIECTLDSPDQGAKGIACSSCTVTDTSISVSIAALGASYSATLEGESLVGTFSQMGARLPLTLKRGIYEPRRPQTPTQPYPYKTEDVAFHNEADGCTLQGTLTYPIGYDGNERVPVVLMISGSGLQNRDEELFNHKPFLVIADHLARHGIATLRYDDRGYGASTAGHLPITQATTPDFARDAEAGIDYLRGLDRFGSIGALGHSEGGNIVFMLAARQRVDFIVSMAGVGAKCDEALTAQYNRIMKAQAPHIPEISVEQYRKNVKATKNAWTEWFIDYDPAADIAAILCPAMILNGDKDSQVISSINLPAIEQTLRPNNKSLIKEYPSLNHLFQHCETGLHTEYATIEETISPEVLNDIAEWINAL